MAFILNKLDHIVFTVSDLSRSIAFYEGVLNMPVVRFGKNNERIALQCGQQKINLHQHKKEFEPKATHPTVGAMDVCFLTQTPVEDIIQHLQEKNIAVIEGIVERTGAMGKIRSIYCRDPDGNLIEIANQH